MVLFKIKMKCFLLFINYKEYFFLNDTDKMLTEQFVKIIYVAVPHKAGKTTLNENVNMCAKLQLAP